MELSLSGVVVVIAVTAMLGWLALRQHRLQLGKRRSLLDDCSRLFDAQTVTWSGDGFPRIEGMQAGRAIDVRLISDGMTIRRLPQLWLQVTELATLEGFCGFSILVRPSGYEFFSLTPRFHYVIDVPPSFPREVIVRGEDERSAVNFEALSALLASILADARVKEIAVTRRGLRIIRQADEGRRGEYLLLRQATFDGSGVSAEMLAHVLRELDTLRVGAAAAHQEPEAA
ncbi:hypothetical protein [Hyphomicrobium nitrativorans]|uniref:hypothetical protein n=1 Tax=Hyphomicrobium nitrativorans TaxID=1427356 RepID=UPI0011835E5E|nr:hypothetical protein [Hyphomicrobium nitrativorans]